MKLNIVDNSIRRKISKTFSKNGCIKMTPINIRLSDIELTLPFNETERNLKYLATMNIKHNADADKLESSIYGENGGYNVNEKLMTVVPLTEYLSGLENYEPFINLYKDDEECVAYAKEVRERALNGTLKSAGKDDKYFVLVGGNTRFSQLLLQYMDGEISNVDDELPFAVLSLTEFKKEFPCTVAVNSESDATTIREWMIENQSAYEFLMLKDNTYFGRQNWPERIFRKSISNIVSAYIDRFHKDDSSTEEFIRSQMGLMKDVGLSYDRCFNLYMLSSFNEVNDTLRELQESNSPLSRSSYFDETHPWFSRKVIEFLRRLNKLSSPEYDKKEMKEMKRTFFQTIGIDIDKMKVSDTVKLSHFLNELAAGILEFKKVSKMTKSQELVRPIWESFEHYKEDFVSFLCEDMIGSFDTIVGKPSDKDAGKIYKAYDALMTINKELRLENEQLKREIDRLKKGGAR